MARTTRPPPDQPDSPPDRDQDEDGLADQWEQRLAIPVIVAAAVSVPAVFLTTLEASAARLAGHALNWASLAVFGTETVVLLLLSRHRLRWIARHKWTIAITAVAVPAVAFTVAPVQALRLLRLVRLIGTLRVLRARTIINAGRIVARRLDLSGHWRYLLVLGATLLAAGFVALVLRDPTAAQRHRAAMAELTGWTGTVPVLVAGAILAIATFIVIRYRKRD